jgi:lipopolysaccharide transport system ATP-binding protein
MSDAIITVENLSKKYLVGHQSGSQSRSNYTALRDVIGREIRNVARQTVGVVRGRQIVQGDEVEEFWALKNVSFEVKQGEVVGIIGRNGAGKSTLLKILSRITEPTQGRVVLRGRVASLLEVGTGFHPELTGRENIFLNGAILGMTRREIQKKFDEIVAFAEVERFLDTPVKRFSSGMYVRLAFAVAAHLEPEILVVDEVLAVGDAEFQQKCLGKMDDVSRREGRTVLFVSHNMSAIERLTERAILLSGGNVTYMGDPQSAVHRYMTENRGDSTVEFDVRNTRRVYRGTGEARITFLRFNRAMPRFQFNEPITYSIGIIAEHALSCVRASMTVYKKDGSPVGSSFSGDIAGIEPGEEFELNVTLPSSRLAPGSYYCGVAIGKGDNLAGHTDYDAVLETLFFDVMPEQTEFGLLGKWQPGWGAISFDRLSAAWVNASFDLPHTVARRHESERRCYNGDSIAPELF